MTKRLSGIPSLAYRGVEAPTPPNVTFETRQPTVNDRHGYNIGDFWVRKSPQELWYLAALANQQATWIQLYPAANPGGADQFPTDIGVANEAGGVLNIFGDPNIFTTGGGNTVNVNLKQTITISGTANIGTDVNVGQDLEVGNTVTVNTMTRGLVRSNNTGLLSSFNGTDGQIPIAATAGSPTFANITSTDGSVVITNGPNTIDLSTLGGTGSVKVTTFTASGTWTVDPNAKWVIFYGWDAGAGGGSGRRGAVDSSSGGGGGAGGCFFKIQKSALVFSNVVPLTVTIGAGGLGGAAVTLDNTNGNDGGIGGVTSIGPYGAVLSKNVSPGNNVFQGGRGGGTKQVQIAPLDPLGANFNGGYPGLLGSINAGSSYDFVVSVDRVRGSFGGVGTTRQILDENGRSLCDADPNVNTVGGGEIYLQSVPSYNFQCGIGFQAASGVVVGPFQGLMQGTGGGGGSGAATIPFAGGFGGYVGTVTVPQTPLTTRAAGGIQGGTINGANGIDYTVAQSQTGNLYELAGQGGGGGGGNNAGIGGRGGDGGFPGGGGGGGGGSVNGFDSGAGGNGGNGLVIVYEFLD